MPKYQRLNINWWRGTSSSRPFKIRGAGQYAINLPRETENQSFFLQVSLSRTEPIVWSNLLEYPPTTERPEFILYPGTTIGYPYTSTMAPFGQEYYDLRFIGVEEKVENNDLIFVVTTYFEE